MGSPGTTSAQIISYLRRDLFRNVVPLKTLHLYADSVKAFYFERSGECAALLLLPTQVSLFDVRGYPQTKYVVMLSATHPDLLNQAIAQIPRDCNLVFKLAEDAVRVKVAEQFSVRRTSAYISYTNAVGRVFECDPNVNVSSQLTAEVLDLLEAQGHAREEITEIFASGTAFSFAYPRDDRPVSVCFTFQNFEDIHEIGGVYTVPEERRKGHAQRIVTTALAEIAARGKIPRYVVHESNDASARLAETLRLQPVVTVEHWLHERGGE